MLLSVLLPFYSSIPCFSTFRKLEAAIDSIESNCDGIKYEIVLINDGSNSIYKNLIKSRYPNYKNIKVVGLEKNTGLVNALNIGLRYATGTYVARLDSDDIWLPGKISEQLKFFVEMPDLTLIASGMNIIDGNSKITSRHGGRGDWPSCYAYARDMGCPFPHSSIVARRDIFNLLGGYTHIPFFKHCEDYHLWSRWVRFFKVHSLHRSFLNYFDNPTGVSSTNSENQRKASGVVQSMCESLYLSDNLFNEYLDFLKRKYRSPHDLLKYQEFLYRKWESGGPLFSSDNEEFHYLSMLMPDRIIVRP